MMLLFALYAFTTTAQTQSSAVFTGGNGDGWASNSFIQSFNNIYTGGNEDGYANGSFTQPFANIYTGGNGDGWASAGYLPQAALPITMLSLTAQKQNSTAALIQWQTSNEPATSYFNVERSTDAIHYNYVGKVKASDIANNGMRYDFSDEHPLEGLNYYRLKQVRVNNQVTFSPSRLLHFDEANDASIKYYPNPTNGILNIQLNNKMQQEAAVLNVINASGVVMNQVKIAAGTGRTFQLDLSHYAKGTYLIQVKTMSVNSVQRVVLQ